MHALSPETYLMLRSITNFISSFKKFIQYFSFLSLWNLPEPGNKISSDFIKFQLVSCIRTLCHAVLQKSFISSLQKEIKKIHEEIKEDYLFAVKKSIVDFGGVFLSNRLTQCVSWVRGDQLFFWVSESVNLIEIFCPSPKRARNWCWRKISGRGWWNSFDHWVGWGF